MEESHLSFYHSGMLDPHFKKHAIDKDLVALYKDCLPHKGAKVVLFTWVIPRGLGDYYAQLEAASILKKNHPDLDILLVTLIHAEVAIPASLPPHPHHFVRFTGSVPEEIQTDPLPLARLRDADLILQMPTYYPKTEELVASLQELPSAKPMPKYELLGEYGWCRHPHFHFTTQARSMGLNPLEKGIFIKQIPEKEKAKNRFNLAYTRTKEGLYLYLYSLLKSLSFDTQDIDIACFDMKHLLEIVPELFGTPKWGLKTVHLFYKDYFTEIPLANEGKVLRLLHQEQLPHAEFLKLLAQTEDLFGCTGDGSISEAISSHSMYFIDPLPHQIAFVKDLHALAKARVPESAEWIELMIPDARPLAEKGERMGTLLSDPQTKQAITRLSGLICKEYAVNDFLCHLVNRSLLHKKRPELEIFEAIALDNFLHGDQSADSALAEISKLLLSFSRYGND